MMLISLGSKSSQGKRFRAPGSMHQSRWMTRAIYSRGIKLAAREPHAALGAFQCGPREDSKMLNEFHFVSQNSISD